MEKEDETYAIKMSIEKILGNSNSICIVEFDTKLAEVVRWIKRFKSMKGLDISTLSKQPSDLIDDGLSRFVGIVIANLDDCLTLEVRNHNWVLVEVGSESLGASVDGTSTRDEIRNTVECFLGITDVTK